MSLSFMGRALGRCLPFTPEVPQLFILIAPSFHIAFCWHSPPSSSGYSDWSVLFWGLVVEACRWDSVLRWSPRRCLNVEGRPVAKSRRSQNESTKRFRTSDSFRLIKRQWFSFNFSYNFRKLLSLFPAAYFYTSPLNNRLYMLSTFQMGIAL